MSSSYAIPSGSKSQNIMLDSSIRDWVVLPLLLIMVFAGLIRHYLSILLRSSEVKKIPPTEHRPKNALGRASRLRSGAASYLSKEKWEARRQYFCGTAADDDSGYLKEESQWIEEEEEKASKKAEDDDNMPDPMAMMGPLKGQFAFMIQNMVMMQAIGYFFNGYVLVKVPIPLTQGFKMMFQKGLDLKTLDTSYVSSISWYFLVMYGLRAFFKLVIDADDKYGGGQKEFMDAAMIQADLGNSLVSAPPGKKYDGKQAIKMEIEAIELARHRGILDDADKRILGKRYTSMKRAKSTQNDPGFDIFGAAKMNKVKGA